MKKYMVYFAVMFLFVLGGCDKEAEKAAEKEEIIYYSSWLDGQWQSTGVKYCTYPFGESDEFADSLVGKIYDFSMPWDVKVDGGALPIRDGNAQFFFWPEFCYYLSELGLEGNYYAIVCFAESGAHPCLFIKDEDEMLITELDTGVYYAHRVAETEELQHAYDKELAFQENIEKRMEVQGITYEPYYNAVWEGYWTIEEVVFAEDMQEAETYVGKEVTYNHMTEYFDLEFPDSPQDKIFYGMPTVEELGLDGKYYIIIWASENEFPAAIVKSEHEMFLIKENMVFRAVQEETYLDETLLQAF